MPDNYNQDSTTYYRIYSVLRVNCNNDLSCKINIITQFTVPSSRSEKVGKFRLSPLRVSLVFLLMLTDV